MAVASIIFLQGEEGREITDKLYDVEGVVARGATEESIAAAVEYLTQWDYGEYHNVTEEAQHGTQDDVWELGKYTLTANLGLGYVGLSKTI